MWNKILNMFCVQSLPARYTVIKKRQKTFYELYITFYYSTGLADLLNRVVYIILYSYSVIGSTFVMHPPGNLMNGKKEKSKI